MEYNIRKAMKQDCKDIMRLIKAMAAHYHLGDQVIITEEVLKKDGFTHNLFHCLVVELPPGQKSKEGFSIVAFLFFYFTYSSWQGRTIALEDMYIMPEFRGNQMGTMLLSTVARLCLDLGCIRMQLIVTEENKAAFNWYLHEGAVDVTADEGWHILRFQGDAVKKMSNWKLKIKSKAQPLPPVPKL